MNHFCPCCQVCLVVVYSMHKPMCFLHLVWLQLSATDASAQTTMKGAAKCDKHCELQNSVNQSGFERILCFWDIPESVPASVFMFELIPSACRWWCVLVCGCVLGCAEPLTCALHWAWFHPQHTQWTVCTACLCWVWTGVYNFQPNCLLFQKTWS